MLSVKLLIYISTIIYITVKLVYVVIFYDIRARNEKHIQHFQYIIKTNYNLIFIVPNKWMKMKRSLWKYAILYYLLNPTKYYFFMVGVLIE